MSLFGKLKERLFKSSTKLEEGLDAIVQEGGTAEPAAPEPVAAEPEAPVQQATPDAPDAPNAPDEAPAQAPAAQPAAPAAARPGLLGRLMGRSQPDVVRRVLDDAMLEQLEELLIASDMGVDTALRVSANMAEGRFGKRLSTDEIKALLAAELARILEPVARPMPIYPKRPQVVLVVGVNGSGKTTTIGKLASQFRAAGKTVVIAAGDTFRAAAVAQLSAEEQKKHVLFHQLRADGSYATILTKLVERASTMRYPDDDADDAGDDDADDADDADADDADDAGYPVNDFHNMVLA